MNFYLEKPVTKPWQKLENRNKNNFVTWQNVRHDSRLGGKDDYVDINKAPKS